MTPFYSRPRAAPERSCRSPSAFTHAAWALVRRISHELPDNGASADHQAHPRAQV